MMKPNPELINLGSKNLLHSDFRFLNQQYSFNFQIIELHLQIFCAHQFEFKHKIFTAKIYSQQISVFALNYVKIYSTRSLVPCVFYSWRSLILHQADLTHSYAGLYRREQIRQFKRISRIKTKTALLAPIYIFIIQPQRLRFYRCSVLPKL